MDEQISTGNGKKVHSARPSGRTPLPVDESREDKFVRLAQQRMSHVKKHTRLVANLATYPHTDAQRDRILSELRKLVAEVETAFAPTRRDDNFRF
jgi:hypothetical protein